MDEETYLQTQQQIFMLTKMANALDLQGFLAAINHSETVAPMLDPTLYMKVIDNLGNIKSIASALSTFKQSTEEPFKQLIQSVKGGLVMNE